jgi:prolyl 4-hydroxylase
VPFSVFFLGILLSFFMGSLEKTVQDLPAPVNVGVSIHKQYTQRGCTADLTCYLSPQVAVNFKKESTRKILLSEKSGEIKPAAATTKPIDPLLPEAFEKFAMTASGFSDVRPALQAAESGESFMHVIPFQTISWYPRITYYPGKS